MTGAWKNPRLSGRIHELDALRGLAILMVLIFHYVVGPARVPSDTVISYSLALLRLAWSGVDLFFVLSGFLIGGILIDARWSVNYFTTFYARRIHRIFPLYFIWLTLFLIGVRLGSASLGGVFNWELPAWSYVLFLQNFSIVAKHQFGPAWMAATWSLAVEEQFYLLFPLVVRYLNRRILYVSLAMVTIVVSPLWRLMFFWGGDSRFGPYFRVGQTLCAWES